MNDFCIKICILCVNSLDRKLEKVLRLKKLVGAVLIDLLRAFDPIPHDLLIVKMYAYGLTIDAVTFFYSYLKRRKQNVYSVFHIFKYT